MPQRSAWTSEEGEEEGEVQVADQDADLSGGCKDDIEEAFDDRSVVGMLKKINDAVEGRGYRVGGIVLGEKEESAFVRAGFELSEDTTNVTCFEITGSIVS